MLTDGELLEAWRAGDRNAGGDLIGRHFEPVCRFFRSKLGGDVEDLVQRTFLDCLERRDQIPAPSFRSYLFSVARNRLFDHFRKGLRQPVDAMGEVSIVDVCTSQPGRLIRAQHSELIVDALQRLPVDFQIALELTYWEDLSGPEIGAVLGISEHTVRSRLSRARATLRSELKELSPTPAEARQTLVAFDARVADREDTD